jgi:hypothetical protein
MDGEHYQLRSMEIGNWQMKLLGKTALSFPLW